MFLWQSRHAFHTVLLVKIELRHVGNLPNATRFVQRKIDAQLEDRRPRLSWQTGLWPVGVNDRLESVHLDSRDGLPSFALRERSAIVKANVGQAIETKDR
jgi:hypothetical protein